MMDYTTFKKVAENEIRGYLPEAYQNAMIDVAPVNKVNKTKDAMMVRLHEDTEVAPTMYLDDAYERYKETDDLNGVLKELADAYAEHIEKGREIGLPKLTKEYVSGNVVMAMVNTESNQALLSDKPHREVNDCSVIYRLLIDQSGDGMATTIVTDKLAEAVGMDEQELFMRASENTKKLLPTRIRSMNEIIMDMMVGEGMPRDMAEDMVGSMEPGDVKMWVITNEKGINGAVNMLYDENLHGLSEKLGDDLYVLPSSVHEVICVPASMGTPEELQAMVQEVNMTAVSLEERLSNQVYHYDSNLRKLTMATDTPNKRIDGMVAEQPLIYEAKEQKR